MMPAFEEQGDGPVVVLLHGFPFDRSMWSGLAGYLAGSYRVILPDLRGFGRSPVVGGPATMEAMAGDVIALLDHLGVTGPVAVGGLSMGGYVALALAVAHPDRVGALLLCNTRAGADTPEAAARREESARSVEATGQPGALIDGMIPKLFAPRTAQERPEVVAEIESVMRSAAPAAIAAALRGMAARPDRTPDLPGIGVPALVIAGEEDAIVPVDEARAMAEALPRGEFQLVAGVGHLAPIEAPEVVHPAVKSFLDGRFAAV